MISCQIAHSPGRFFDDDKISELADSIREHGMIQPVVVRPASGDGFEIVAGERRWRAARKADLRVIPVLSGNFRPGKYASCFDREYAA